jgi:hypothetical protein
MIRWTILKQLFLTSNEKQNGVWVGVIANDID